MKKTTVIIVAAGNGARSGLKQNKIFAEIDGQTCIEKTFYAFVNSGVIDQYIVAAKKEEMERVRVLLPDFAEFVEGGKTRSQSVKNALKKADGDVTLIHDGARPFVSEKIIKDCVKTAEKYGSAIAAIPSADTVAFYDGQTARYLGKENLLRVQTPQAFITAEIKDAYAACDKDLSDDGQVYLNHFKKLNFVDGDAANIKLTYPEDFFAYADDCNGTFSDVGKGENGDFGAERRFGTGFDCHRLVKDRKLILGGVLIPHDKGLLGHSDADVLTHAVADAVLSACAMRDIGFWFPDNDEKYKGADSMKLLAEVLRMVAEKGFKPESVSAVIMAEKPKLSKTIPVITENLANALDLSPDKVGISATTLEGLGFVGREEGICVRATAVLKKI